MKRLLTLMTVALLALATQAQQAIHRTRPLPGTRTGWHYTGTWAAAAEYTGEGDMPQCSLAGKSIRQIIRVSCTGDPTGINSKHNQVEKYRLQLSNEFGSSPVEIRAVYVADALDSCNIDTATVRQLTFACTDSTGLHTTTSVTIPPGKTIYSQGFLYDLKPLQRLAITICYGEQVPQHATSHRGSRTTSYIMEGQADPIQPFETIEKVDHWYNIAKLEVVTRYERSIAILGNSITDGRGSTTNAQNRWPDFLATALKGGKGVLNLGIGGNCVIEGGLSEPALQRFDRDILGQAGVETLIIFEGTNDIGCSADKDAMQVAQRLIEAYQTLIDKAHQKGIKVYMATITPFKGNGWYSRAHEKARQKVNEWIRTQNVADGIIDFDQLVRDPQDPKRLLPAYSDDWLHLNPSGYEAMGKYAAKELR